MIFRQLTRLAALMVPLTLGGQAMAFQERQSFDVSVTIPIHEAYVLPSEPDWMGQDQLLAWDLTTSGLAACASISTSRISMAALRHAWETCPIC